ncbi:hypothetical protein IM792_02800 [Mucilaginibacter sp. JRF]|uniref:hypothetical protein n=1 Tax=Mucilaginibacter sp. JRF TaxID=2780088 RepID=UPI00187F30AF|nr:hypothetical protein [Mucilaginibacter sp. JRF]MBE9583366.1 hypothetical protein [Mucilaginibacter sp. JRF]
MITIKTSIAFLCLAFSATLMFTGCNTPTPDSGTIPYDERNASKHVISVRKAAQLTAGYRLGKMKLIRQLGGSDYLDQNFNLPDAELFNRDAIALLLNQKGTKGVRIYLGQDDKGLIRLVLVGVDDKGNDITNSEGSTPDGAVKSAMVLEAGQRCPTMCSATGPIK